MPMPISAMANAMPPPAVRPADSLIVPPGPVTFGAFDSRLLQHLAVCSENLKFDHSGDEVRQGWRVNE
jgi:hypothetical protein